MGYAKQIWIDQTEQCGERWVDHQDDELFIAQMRDLGWDWDEATDHLAALKEDYPE